MQKSNRKPASRKPTDFPLTKHPRGYWCKKVKGKLHYFGKVSDDPDGKKALDKWLEQRDDLLAGRTPRVSGDGLTIGELSNRYLTSHYHKLIAGELSPRTFADLKMSVERVSQAFGKQRLVDDVAADDFAQLRREIAKTRNPQGVGNEIKRIRGVFKFARDNHLVKQEVRFGTEFRPPCRRVLRKVRNGREKKFLEADEIRRMIDGANIQMRAMILLGVNAGLGNSDVANVPTTAVNLKTGWLTFPRPKTGIDRRCPLWTETVEAVKAWLAVRPEPKDPAHKHLLFLTWFTRSTWATDKRLKIDDADPEKVTKACMRSCDNPLSKEVRKLLNKLGIKRKGVAFYSLRHVFETIGGRSRDQVAVDHIMGHADESMAARYREAIDDDRLRAVTDLVHEWLFPKPAEQEATPEAEAGDDQLTGAVRAARAAIEATTGPVRATLESAWSGTITAALAGDGDAWKRLVATWG